MANPGSSDYWFEMIELTAEDIRGLCAKLIEDPKSFSHSDQEQFLVLNEKMKIFNERMLSAIHREQRIRDEMSRRRSQKKRRL